MIAGVRDETERLEVLDRKAEGIHPVCLDVTDPDQVEEVAGQIRREAVLSSLVGLVNSAGVVLAGPLEVLPDRDLRRQFDVNLFGLLRARRAVLRSHS